METTRKLAELSTRINYDDFPEEAISKAKECILDTLGCILGGCKESEANLMLRYIDEIGGRPEATIIGFGKKTDAPNAALVNGTIGHALDFDDTHHSLMGHPSVVILPAVLAVGEKAGSSGKEFLEAFITGYEVSCKVGRGVNPQLYKNGWHATSVIGILGAAVGAGRLLHLNADQMASLIGISASQSSGLRENFGTMTKPFHAGRASQSAVISSILVKNGFTASKSILEAKNGFCTVFSGKYDLNRIIKDFANPFDIVSPGVHLKPYPSCLETHSIIEATLFISESYNIEVDDVKSVDCEIAPLAFDILIHSNPDTGLEGKFSAQYAIATTLIHKKASLEQFTDEAVQDPKVKEVLKKIKVSINPEFEKSPQTAVVTVYLKDGRVYSKRIDITLGHPERPMSLEQIKVKYISCAEGMIDRESVEKSIDMILNIERLKDIREMIQLVAKG